MLAVDTNVIVRYLVNDDPQQSPRAKALIDRENVFVATTVLLETEWVLREVYEFSTPQLAAALRAFVGLPRITLEDPDATACALDWLDVGMDFADALHLTKAGDYAAFVSFDKRLARLATRFGGTKVRTL